MGDIAHAPKLVDMNTSFRAGALYVIVVPAHADPIISIMFNRHKRD